MKEAWRRGASGATAGSARSESARRRGGPSGAYRGPATALEHGAMSARRQGEGKAVAHFRDVAGHDPWPWQLRLHARLVAGDIPDAVDVPTGCGKTACVLLALLARLEHPGLPRRIVYVVDRRAIVDQTAAAISVWIDRMAALPALVRAFDACAAFPADRPVALGVVRGGLADDGARRADPARLAVIVGTVDMVGSRLLFSGYGDGRSMRALHAGLLGHDALVVLDEAHLAPAFATLLGSVERLQGAEALRTMTLSATARGSPPRRHLSSGRRTSRARPFAGACTRRSMCDARRRRRRRGASRGCAPRRLRIARARSRCSSSASRTRRASRPGSPARSAPTGPGGWRC